MAVSLEKIQKLREETMASMADVKKALDEAQGDEEKALFILKKQGKIIAEKKSSRETNAGIVASYVHQNGRIGVLIEVRCETDFVAKNTEFQALVHDLTLHIAAMKPEYVRQEDVPQAAIDAEKKVFEAQTDEMKGKPADVIEKIIEGKLKKYFDDVCLLNQPFVKDDSKTVRDRITECVAKVGENIDVSRFVRFEV
ncbi:elongation factor Ts [Candidatus Azambacteria bacterium RBG_16_47_10]|uniref:Elongation factor Ts n=1 Tax=Candidatus Azambacteria bacterium RBG_16_47_10 TaxID=1797292 RepID=A0A1F5AZC6_9BACT|nr:MAG: elongation factor Ts [Candidatus Azambacteria bacterium RBG_16_47_10]